MKILTVIGARPQFIKAACLSPFLREKNKEIIVHTGQHYDKNMSDIFFEDLELPEAEYNLNVGSGLHGQQTAKMMKGLEPIIIKENPDYVMVYGDTNSTFAASLVASKLNIKIIHIEAGLRSFDMCMPEEINRVLTDRLSSLLFVPTQTGIDNLKKEGITQGVYKVGDVMCDILMKNISIAEEKSDILRKNKLEKSSYILLTVHRQALTDDLNVLLEILNVIKDTKEICLFPIHPRTKNILKQQGVLEKIEKFDNFRIIDPVGYLDSICLIKNARIVITDSGGVQKESYLLGVGCITVRENTEWVETVETGWNCLAGFSKNKLRDALNNFNPKGKSHPELYGSGNAAMEISKIIGDVHKSIKV